MTGVCSGHILNKMIWISNLLINSESDSAYKHLIVIHELTKSQLKTLRPTFSDDLQNQWSQYEFYRHAHFSTWNNNGIGPRHE